MLNAPSPQQLGSLNARKPCLEAIPKTLQLRRHFSVASQCSTRQFDANDALHVDFLLAAANLYAASLGREGVTVGAGAFAAIRVWALRASDGLEGNAPDRLVCRGALALSGLLPIGCTQRSYQVCVRLRLRWGVLGVC